MTADGDTGSWEGPPGTLSQLPGPQTLLSHFLHQIRSPACGHQFKSGLSLLIRCSNLNCFYCVTKSMLWRIDKRKIENVFRRMLRRTTSASTPIKIPTSLFLIQKFHQCRFTSMGQSRRIHYHAKGMSTDN